MASDRTTDAPGDRFDGHARADRNNLFLHRAALEKLDALPDGRKACLKLVDSWLAAPQQPARRWLEEWRTMLADWPVERIAGVVLAEDAGQSLRQCSPLGPLLSPTERWRLLEEARRLDETQRGAAR